MKAKIKQKHRTRKSGWKVKGVWLNSCGADHSNHCRCINRALLDSEDYENLKASKS